ncbi:hypothetical protein [Roseivivax marinus]|uniref:hypothetical protein n=1 Tax=Roseivivax marinus TaxID=1379903 RepID=UPI00273D6A0C|nr:hypothetical protein [Roseivivax marinus]
MPSFSNRIARPGLIAVATALSLSWAEPVSASAMQEFTLDIDQSSIDMQARSCQSRCGVTAAFSQPGEVSHTYSEEGEVWHLRDIIDWTVHSRGKQVYDVVVNLFFTAPTEASSQTEGTGIFFSFMGIFTTNHLSWDDWTTPVNFDNGSRLSVWLEDGIDIALGRTVSSDMHIRADRLAGMSTPSPVPLPPALPAMLAVLGGLFWAGRSKRRTA